MSGVVLLDWSKTGAYLTTAQRPSKGEDGQPAKNIKARTRARASGMQQQPQQQAFGLARTGMCSTWRSRRLECPNQQSQLQQQQQP